MAAAALFLPAMRFARSLLAALSEPGRGRAVDDREKQPGFLKRCVRRVPPAATCVASPPFPPHRSSVLVSALLYVDFFLPLFLALLWVRPMTGSLVVRPHCAPPAPPAPLPPTLTAR